MIKRSFICALVLVVIYSLFVSFFRVKPVVQYTLQDNLVRAQNYMYNDSIKGADVMIGTSMSAKIKQDKLPKNVYILAGAGFSVYDGIALIINSRRHPKYVFIEQNSILLPERPDYIKYLFNVPDYYRKKFIPSMRDGYQPAGGLYSAVFLHTAPRIQWFTRNLLNPAIRVFYKGKVLPVNPNDYYAKEKMQSTTDTNIVKAAFVRLKEKVNELEEGGTKVCFYSVPNAPKVHFSFVSMTIINYFPRYFPPSKYPALPVPDIYAYHEDDGIHMDDTSCAKFTNYIAEKISAVVKK